MFCFGIRPPLLLLCRAFFAFFPVGHAFLWMSGTLTRSMAQSVGMYRKSAFLWVYIICKNLLNLREWGTEHIALPIIYSSLWLLSFLTANKDPFSYLLCLYQLFAILWTLMCWFSFFLSEILTSIEVFSSNEAKLFFQKNEQLSNNWFYSLKILFIT